MKLVLNATELRDLASDLRRFGAHYISETSDERNELLSSLKDSWKNTAAKLILNFGKDMAPVAEEWADLMQYVQVNEDCDQECAMKCYNPQKRDTLFFDQRCLGACKCQFKSATMNREYFDQKGKNLTHDLDHLYEFLKDRKAVGQKILKPRVEAYLEKEKNLHDEFADMIRKHAIEGFGCDKRCINDCLNRKYITFFEIPKCVMHCPCKQRILNLEGGRYNLQHLMEYNDYDLEAW